MFIKRLMVEGASLVCSVDNTNAGERRAFTPISAVFKVADLADRIMLGSAAGKLGCSGKVQADLFFICTWLMPANEPTGPPRS